MRQKLRAQATRKTALKPAKEATVSKLRKRAPAAKKKTTRAPSSSKAKTRQDEKEKPNKVTIAAEEMIRQFRTIVNIEAVQLERWLATPESQKLERTVDKGEVPAEPGRKVLKLLKKRRESYKPEDFKHMRAVIEHVNRRLTKRPKGDIIASNWRYSLMNWGHDPSRPLKRARGKMK